MKDKFLIAAAYIFWLPSLYIVLTEKRKDGFVGSHGARALRLWVFIFILFFLLRFLINLIWYFIPFPALEWLEPAAAVLLWIYALSCGIRAYRGDAFTIPG